MTVLEEDPKTVASMHLDSPMPFLKSQLDGNEFAKAEHVSLATSTLNEVGLGQAWYGISAYSGR